MKYIHPWVFAAGVLVVSAVPVSATPITGVITFDQTVNETLVPTLAGLPTLALATATGLNFAPTGTTGSMTVTGGSDSLAPFTGAVGTITDFNFASFTPMTDFYSVSSGASTLTFDLASIAILYQSAYALVLTGSGTLDLTGYTSTSGVFNLAVTDTGTYSPAEVQFSYSAGSSDPPPAPVTEPATLALFGAGLLGIAGLQWRRRPPKAVVPARVM